MAEKKVLAKVIGLGDMGVGKTTIINSFAGVTKAAKATVGNDFRSKEVKIGNTTVTM